MLRSDMAGSGLILGLLEILTPEVPIQTNVKMTIACNSAYVQTETLNFTFARQAINVYFNAKY